MRILFTPGSVEETEYSSELLRPSKASFAPYRGLHAGTSNSRLDYCEDFYHGN